MCLHVPYVCVHMGWMEGPERSIKFIVYNKETYEESWLVNVYEKWS